MREAKRSHSGFSNREITQKSKRSYHRPNTFNEIFLGDFSKTQGLTIFLILLATIGSIGGFYLYQTSVFHNYIKNPSYHNQDPNTLLWKDVDLNNNVNGWLYNTTMFTMSSLGAGVGYKFGVTSNCNVLCNNPFAIEKDPIDLSTIAGKTLQIEFAFTLTSFTSQTRVGYFLTLNNTITTSGPASSNPLYNPKNDVNVALFLEVTGFSGSTAFVRLWLNPDVGHQTLSQQDRGCIGGAGDGSEFMCNGMSISLTQFNYVYTRLNYTGNSGASGVGTSQLLAGSPTISSIASTVQLPIFNFQGNNFRFGIWNVNNDITGYSVQTDNLCQPLASASLQICELFNTNLSNVPQPQILDTGGFFGPIIRSLINIGVFMTQNLINFLSFLDNIFAPLFAGLIAIFSTVFITVFNALGSIFGDPNLGTQMGTFLSNLSTYLATAFSGEIAFLSSGVQFIINALSIITAFFGGGSNFLTLWLGLLTGIASLISGLNSFLALLLFWFNQGLFGFNIIIIIMLSLLTLSAVVDWTQDDNPLAGFIALMFGFFLFFVLQTNNSTINVIATNPTVLANYQTAWNNVKFFLTLAPILFIGMFIEWASQLGEVRGHFSHSKEFMPNFQTMLKFYIMLTIDIFHGGYWFFHSAYTIITLGITAIKGRWGPVEVAGTG